MFFSLQHGERRMSDSSPTTACVTGNVQADHRNTGPCRGGAARCKSVARGGSMWAAGQRHAAAVYAAKCGGASTRL